MISARNTIALFFAVLCLETVLALGPPAHESVERISCSQAFYQCDFEFWDYHGIPTFYVDGLADESFTSRVVSRNSGETLGVLNSNNITPEFIIHNRAFPITLFGNQKFTPTAFKPFPIEYSPGSGIGHETFQGDQLSVARGQCVRVFFSSYQTLLPNGDVKDNFNHVPRSANKCVVFRTY